MKADVRRPETYAFAVGALLTARLWRAQSRRVPAAARVAMLMISALLSSSRPASADDRIDVGLFLGSTRATDEGGTLQFNRATTFQATFG